MDETTITLLFLIGFVFLCTLLIIAIRVYRTVTATFAGFSWSRKVFLEHSIWIAKQSYAGFPADSRHQYTRQEVSLSSEYTHTRTNTRWENGQMITTSEPVYEMVSRWKTVYHYEIQAWQSSRTLEANGTERTTRSWPTYTLDLSCQERVQNTSEQYLLLFHTARGKHYRKELPEAAWLAFDEAATYTLKVNLFGRIKDFSPDKEEGIEIPQQTS